MIGLLYAVEHCSHGVRTGYAVGGDYSGRGLLVCSPEEESAVLAEAVRRIFTSGIHSLELRYVPRSTAPARFNGLHAKQFDAVIPGDRLQLPANYDSFLSGLGKHTRRNIRNFQRKTVEEGIGFAPMVEREEFERERERLNRTTSFALSRMHLERDDRLLMLHRGGERMALRGPDGALVALVCGFILDRRFHMLSQWNDPRLERLSLSTVLRGYLVEQLIAQGCAELFFMGGTSYALGRFCEPQPFRLILVDRAGGPIALAKRLLAGYSLRRADRGRMLSAAIERLAGAFLDDARIIHRTVLAQALASPPAPGH